MRLALFLEHARVGGGGGGGGRGPRAVAERPPLLPRLLLARSLGARTGDDRLARTL